MHNEGKPKRTYNISKANYKGAKRTMKAKLKEGKNNLRQIIKEVGENENSNNKMETHISKVIYKRCKRTLTVHIKRKPQL